MLRDAQRDPYLDAGMRGFIVNTARANFWRVASWYELDDLVQDGYLCYYKCRNRYTILSVKRHPSPADRRWMQSLVSTAFNNYIHTLASKLRDGCELAVSQLGREDDGEGPVEDVWGSIAPPQLADASLVPWLAELPRELIQLMGVLVGDGAQALSFSRTKLVRRVTVGGSSRVQRVRRPRETSNEYYCRLVGLDPRYYDLARAVEALRRGESLNVVKTVMAAA